MNTMETLPLILIIEDSHTQAKVLSIVLERYHLRTVIASDGAEGLRAAVEYHPDLIILDVNMPKMDGYQVCRRLKRDQDTMHIPVIMMTVSDDSQAMVKGLEAGADDYIAKDEWATENMFTTLRSYIAVEKGRE